MIKVVVCGAAGRMGRTVAGAVCRAEDLQLVGAVDVHCCGVDLASLAGLPPSGVVVESDLDAVLAGVQPDVVVDFTGPSAVMNNVKTSIMHKVRPVVGTTGMKAEALEEIKEMCEKQRLGCVIAPNFAVGAVLMMHFASIAAKYMPSAEIIELHHDQKVDAPSGTALKTAQIISASRGDFRQGLAGEQELLPGARGGDYGGLRIHSVRLPGLMAHQEIIFGGLGQTLSIRHDSVSRDSFMPGILLAIRRVMDLTGVVYGLEKLLFE